MRGGPSCTGGRVQLPHSNKLTSPLAHMFIAVVTAMDESDVSIETNESDVSVESDDQGLLDADGNTGRGSRRGPLHLHQEGSQMWGCDMCPEMN